MLMVMRFWRHLSLRRWAGQEHGIDTVLTHRRPKTLAVYCPACPEVGVNVDEAEIRLVYETKTYAIRPSFGRLPLTHDRHLYTLFISLDGNFRLQRKRKNDDPNDTALNTGNAYFVENTAYQQYCKSLQKVPEVCS